MSNFVGIPFSFSSNFSFLSHVFINIDVYKKIDSLHIYPLNERAMSQHQLGNKFCTVLQLPVEIDM